MILAYMSGVLGNRTQSQRIIDALHAIGEAPRVVWLDASSFHEVAIPRPIRVATTGEAILVALRTLRARVSDTPTCIVVNGWELAVAASRVFPGVPLVLFLDSTPMIMSRQSQEGAGSRLRRIGYRCTGLVYSRLFRRALRSVKWAFPISTGCATSLTEGYGFATGRVTVSSIPQERRFLETQRVDSTGDVLRVLFVGNDVVRKGGPRLLEIASGLQHLPFRFTVVSSDPVAQEMDWPQNVELISGLSSSSMLLQYYLSSDILVLPTRRDQLPNVIGEALATGVMPIVADVGSVRELIQDGVTGFVLDTEAPTSAWTELLIDLEGDRRRVRDMGTAGRDFAHLGLSPSLLESRLRRAIYAAIGA